MKTIIKKIVATVGILTIVTPMIQVSGVAASGTKVVYPIQEMSKLECRFRKFSELGPECKQQLPILHTEDYKKYSQQGGGYNEYTRIYTVLWGASYKYGWDQGYGGHMGVDIATAEGTPVYAMADGVVIKAGKNGEFGNLVSIKHTINGKTIVSNYGHMSKIDTTVGARVSAGTKVGEVGTTGNSTGNHLHFQIDTNTAFTPIYYSRKTCPYSYYEITESGKCFDELSRITVDPLKFLETNGAILEDVHIGTTKIEAIDTVTTPSKPKNSGSTTSSSSKRTSSSAQDLRNGAIFERTVYQGYAPGDIRNVQRIYKSLGYYKGEITGDYTDVEESIIDYQLEKGVISSRSEDGAGRFGPKTRAQTKKDWDKYIANGGKIATVLITGNNNEEEEESEEEVTTDNNQEISYTNDNRVTIKTEKIERKTLLTREEIEQREIKEFMSKYNIDLQFQHVGGNIRKGDTESLALEITDKKGRPFKGNMPGGMTFIANKAQLDVFPEKLYYFTDGKREIKITGLSEGTTNLYIKIGNTTIKTFKIKVYNGNKSITPESAMILAPKDIRLGDNSKALAVFKDDSGKNLINLPFTETYTLKASPGSKVCLKKGNLSQIRSVYQSSCDESDFKEEVNFTYSDTVSGILVFDFKAITDSANVSIVKTGKSLVTANVHADLPKGLANNYTYKDEVLNGIKSGIATAGMKQGYFLEDRKLTEYDGYAWLENTLKMTKSTNPDTQQKISELAILRNGSSKTKVLTRLELLALSYKYLVNENITPNVTIEYNDLSDTQNKMANAIFNQNNTWKDMFGANHFRPNEELTRGEGVFLLMNAVKNTNTNLLTRN